MQAGDTSPVRLRSRLMAGWHFAWRDGSSLPVRVGHMARRLRVHARRRHVASGAEGLVWPMDGGRVLVDGWRHPQACEFTGVGWRPRVDACAAAGARTAGARRITHKRFVSWRGEEGSDVTHWRGEGCVLVRRWPVRRLYAVPVNASVNSLAAAVCRGGWRAGSAPSALSCRFKHGDHA